MIGILAKLAKAAKMAQTAEAAIDVATNRLAPEQGASGNPGAGTRPEAESGQGSAPAGPPNEYQSLLDEGLPDARELLSSKEAVEIIGKRIRKVSLTGTEDCLICDYHCEDRAGTVLGVHLTASLPWEGFDSEITKKEVFHELGDAAFRGGRQIYVKCGETTFWIHTAGEVMVDMAVRAAKLVASRLEKLEDTQNPDPGE